MQITIETDNLSDEDVQILRFLVGNDAPAASPVPAAAAPANVEPPAKRFTAADFKEVPGVGRKTAQLIVEHLYGDDAEAPAPDEEDEAPEAEDENDGDGPTMSDAVAAATRFVSSGKAAQVKAALAEVGAKRVSEMDEGDIPAFMAALEA